MRLSRFWIDFELESEDSSVSLTGGLWPFTTSCQWFPIPRFRFKNALDYLIGEQLVKLAEAATPSQFLAKELPFLAAMSAR
jgi:hypothetical protein